MNAEYIIEELKREGYHDVGTVHFSANQEVPEHTHDEATVHVILSGELTLIEGNEEMTMKQGERFEIPKGTTHRAAAGPEGCIFAVGVKKSL